MACLNTEITEIRVYYYDGDGRRLCFSHAARLSVEQQELIETKVWLEPVTSEEGICRQCQKEIDG